jgi:rhodanese-related sulfurtransferase
MNPKRISAKFAATPETASKPDLHGFMLLFHKFIQLGSVEGLLVDVADYAHVPKGPSVILIGHEVDYAIDDTGSGLGLLTVRKRCDDDALGDVLCDTLRKALTAISAIEADGSTGLRFEASGVEVRLLDRLVAPNTDAGFAEVRAEFQRAAEKLYGEGVVLTRAGADDSRQALGVSIQSAEAADLEVLLDRLGGRVVTPRAANQQSEWDISVEDLKKLRDENSAHVLVDVREPSEYETCNLGGKSIPLGTLAGRLGELDPVSHVVAHCKLGDRGAKAVALLRQAGFENAWNLNGGIIAWIDRVDSSLKKY